MARKYSITEKITYHERQAAKLRSFEAGKRAGRAAAKKAYEKKSANAQEGSKK